MKDPKKLRDLVGAPEGDRVERKRTADAATLAKVVSGFANTDGGWLLLGVDDDGSLVGWRPKGRGHPRDWLRDVMETVVDPIPYFEAELFEMDGVTVGIVHVPRSSSAPHFIDATGEVFERRNGQTRRAHGARVRQLMLRGGGSTESAKARLDNAQVARDVAVTLDAPRQSTSMHPRAIASVLRVSLSEVTEDFVSWVHSSEALQRSHSFVWSVAHALNDRDWCTPPQPLPARTTAGGHVATTEWDGRLVRKADAAWDRVGLGGVRLAGERPDDSGVFYLLSNQVRDRWLMLSLEYLVDALVEAGAFGAALLRWDLYGVRGADVTTVRNGGVVTAQGVVPPHYNNMVEIDCEVELGASSASELSHQLWRQLELLAGAQHY